MIVVPNKRQIEDIMAKKKLLDQELDDLEKQEELSKEHENYKIMMSVLHFDVFYGYSDDGQVYRNGVEREKVLREAIKLVKDDELRGILEKGLSEINWKEFTEYARKEGSPTYAYLRRHDLREQINKDYVMVLGKHNLSVDQIHHFLVFRDLVASGMKSITPKYGFVKGGVGVSTGACLKFIRENGYLTPPVAVSARDEETLDGIVNYFRKHKNHLISVITNIGYDNRGIDLWYVGVHKKESVYLLSHHGLKMFL